MKFRYVRMAKIHERIIAFWIDNIILSIVTSMLTRAILFYMYGSSYISQKVASIIIFALVYGFKDIGEGASFGKRIFKIAVRDASDPEKIPSQWRRFLRNATLLLLPIEFFALFLSARKERVGDILTKTVVVKLETVKAQESELDNVHDLQKYHKERDVDLKKYYGKLKKQLSVIAVILVLTLLTFIFVVTHVMKQDPSYELATEAIMSSSEVAELVGDEISFGLVPNGSVEYRNNYGTANFLIKVNGDKGRCKVIVNLSKYASKKWKIVHFAIIE